MATNVLMPKLSDTMEDGKILRWLKQPGDAVSVGEVLAEVETDKADMEIEAEAAGVISEILVPAGGAAGVGDVIASLRNEEHSSKPSASSEDREKIEESAVEKPSKPSGLSSEDPAMASATVPSGGGEALPTPDNGPRSAQASSEALQLAGKHGIDVSKLSGSGPGGWVVSRDLKVGAVKSGEAVPAPTRNATGGPHREELSRIRRTVARRMVESKREAPHFYLTAEMEMDNCMRLKEGLRAARPDLSVS
jgi:pyruvate dehydrogenase E2 component (dihydrolipoamide acetyltransferase)